MNIMLVSVTERIREVGLRKAIGAKTMHILVQFLIEAIILTFFGGIIGAIIGYLLALLIGIFVGATPILSPAVVFVCISVSTMIGLVFGVYPAKKSRGSGAYGSIEGGLIRKMGKSMVKFKK